jgi:hypothetical protein
VATAAGEPHRLRLASATSAAGSLVAEVGYALGALPPRGEWLSEELVLACGDWVLTVADLRDLEPLLLERGLPNLWVPSSGSFAEIAELPVLGSGKLDLRHLGEMARERFPA